ncbi:uncharacterized protein DSM5745_05395 [Aspergillus mulundensis]|uniref:Uncharacterized protein n=1 Tax=Aspergillus mulundensis TaxID=1810919 RepID=A0A3D8RWX6_9EURO|nr:Uncharacterized protein DSM5745_05395 [Aspergillus mulundensis]RDW78543.1 Uncharacterized protein DSM5745_05395 [Aspergillus mulundensis]
MEVSQKRVDKVQAFVEDRQKAEKFYDEQRASPSDIQTYERKLDNTLKELQERVRQQEEDLRKLRAANANDISDIGTDPASRIAQIRRAKKAYDSLLKSDTSLPEPESPLPSLIALDETSRIITESKDSVSATAEKLASARQRLKIEETNLRDAQSIRDGLRKRIDNIRKDKSASREKLPSEVARELLEQQRRKKDNLDEDTAQIRAVLHKFCDEVLASMIAAEDLGGPAVGDVAEVSDVTLAAGYTRHGKPKKPKAVEEDNQENNQHRIDDMLRRQTGQSSNQPSSRRETAATEVHELLDSLLGAGSSYLDIQNESAASRFLVRAKVAQFHPRDARRLRLIDFGRSLND